jgi:YidC/Oxa1 family membrane protein insertase
MHVGPVGVFNGIANYDWGFEDLLEEGDQRFNSTGGWIGFTDKYWLTALIPNQQAAVNAGFLRGRGGGFQAISTPETRIVQPGQAGAFQSHLFAGAKEVEVLERYSEALGTEARARDRLGLVPLVHEADLLAPELAVRAHRQFRCRDHLPHLIVRALMFPIARSSSPRWRRCACAAKMKAIQDRYRTTGPHAAGDAEALQEEKVNPVGRAACRSCCRSRSSTRSTRC